jgi:periplasmic divalent cation tolerance protein
MSEPLPTLRLVLTAVDGEEPASTLAETLVRDRLAACANVLGPVRSFFYWEERLERATEWILILKTRDDRLEALRAALARRHPYKVPEILALPPVVSTEPYAAWATQVLGASSGTEGQSP